MADQPTVSIVMPVYNAQSFLAECIESLLGQTYDALELLFVDDGSTDETPEILARFAERDSRIRLFSQQNAGPGVARNLGIDQATGEYLYFFDSDDFCENTLIERAVSRARETDADIVVLPFFQYDERVGMPLEADWALLRDKFPADVSSWRDNPDWLFRSFQNFPWNKLMRRDFVEAHHLRFQEIYLTEDLMFAAPALVKAERIACLDDALVYHREGTGQNVMANKDAHPLDFLTAFSTLKRYLVDEGVYDDLRVAFANWAVDGCISNLHTLTSKEGFVTVVEALKQGGMAELGLYDIDPALLYEQGYRTFVDSVRTLSAQEYLFSLYRTTALERDLFRQRSSAEYHQKCDRDAEINRLWIEIDRLHGIIREKTAECDDLRFRFDEMANAAEQRVGRVVCYIPRMVQRAIAGRTQDSKDVQGEDSSREEL